MDALTCCPSLARAIKSSLLPNSAILTPHNVNLIEHRGTKITLVRLNLLSDSRYQNEGFLSMSTGIGADLSGEFFQEFQDLGLIDRLGQITLRGRDLLPCRDEGLELPGNAGHDDDGDLPPLGALLHLPVEPDPALVGHGDVQRDEVRGLFLDLGQRFVTILRLHRSVTAVFEQRREVREHVGFIVDDQDGLFICRHAPPPLWFGFPSLVGFLPTPRYFYNKTRPLIKLGFDPDLPAGRPDCARRLMSSERIALAAASTSPAPPSTSRRSATPYSRAFGSMSPHTSSTSAGAATACHDAPLVLPLLKLVL